ncbi:hypothetical protein JCM24511_02085 [Saitozyma sp. JCM 24511]|nr:hypothetical protein JCM24511_02085 [Saitozyma sp. JCM 24511]
MAAISASVQPGMATVQLAPESSLTEAQTAGKLDDSQVEYHHALGITEEVEEVLKRYHAYVWNKDERGNLLVQLCVSGYSTGVEQMQKEFGFSTEVGTVGLSLFILGFALGPMLLAPLSEYWGRRPVYLVSWTIFTLFQLPLALAKNLQTILVCRFIQGFAGSAPLGIVLSTYLAQTKGWRWLYWVYLIVFGAFLVIIFLGLPETRDTIVLQKKSKFLRNETNQPFYAEHELAKKDPSHLYKVTIVRPFKFLFTEPITYLCAGINGFVFGIIFLSNEAFPLVFGSGNGGHNWTHSGTINLTFASYVVGSVIAFALQPLQESKYHLACRRLGASDPEARWWSALWATPFMPAGLMVAAWTSYPSLPWIPPLIGFAMFGFGFYVILAAILNYVVDGYGHYSASALGGVVFVRNIVGAIFPLFSMQIFVGLGNQWALFLLAVVSLLLIPIPSYLYYRGKIVRERSPYCATHFGKEG